MYTLRNWYDEKPWIFHFVLTLVVLNPQYVLPGLGMGRPLYLLYVQILYKHECDEKIRSLDDLLNKYLFGWK